MGMEKLFGGGPDTPADPAKQAEVHRRRLLAVQAKQRRNRPEDGTLGNPSIVKQGLASRLGNTGGVQ